MVKVVDSHTIKLERNQILQSRALRSKKDYVLMVASADFHTRIREEVEALIRDNEKVKV